MGQLNTALVLATYLITFLGVVAGIIAGVQGYLNNKQKSELESLKKQTREEIEAIKKSNISSIEKYKQENVAQLARIANERDSFRHELLSRLITADRLAMVNDICGNFLGSESHQFKDDPSGSSALGAPRILHDYHDLQSNLLTLLSCESVDKISTRLSDLGGQIGCYGKDFDRSVFYFLNELWVQGFFHQSGMEVEFSNWYDRSIGEDGPILSKINRFGSEVEQI